MIIQEYSLVGFSLNPYAKENESKNPGIKMNTMVKIPNVFSIIKNFPPQVVRVMFDRERKTLSSSDPTSHFGPSHRHLAGKSRRPKKREWRILIISAAIMSMSAWAGVSLLSLSGLGKSARKVLRWRAGAESDKNQPGV